MKLRYSLSTVAVAMTFGATVFGSPAVAQPEIEEEVVVTATRSPFSIDKVPFSVRVISAEEIERSAASSIEAVLRGEGALQLRDSAGTGKSVTISLRGMSGGQNAAILVDGRRLNNSDLSEPDLDAVDMQNIERIEILEGGAGVLFGDQAVGGVVNIITRQPGSAGGMIEAEVGSYQQHKISGSFGGRAAGDAVDYRVSAEKEASDGYRDNTEVEYTSFRGEGGYTYGDGRIFLEAQHRDNDYLLPGGLLEFQRQADRRQSGSSFNDYRIDADTYRLGLNHHLNGIGNFYASYGRREEDVSILGNSLTFGASRTDQLREVETFDPRMVFELGEWRVTVGADIENYDYDLAVDSAFGLSTSSHNHERHSEYVQAIYFLGEDIQLSAGYRYASLDVNVDGGYFNAAYDDNINVKQVGVSWQVMENFRVFLNRDETFRFPLADENVDFLGNVVALNPQEGVAWELGSRWQQDNLELGLTFFEHGIEDEIGYDVNTFANINFDDTRRRGATFDAYLRVSDEFDVRASATRMDAEFEAGELDGNRLPGVAETLGKLVGSYRLSEGLSLQGEVVYTGSVAVDMYGIADDMPGYTIYNVAANYAVGGWLLKARINNLTGKEYSEYVTFFGVPAYYPSPKENARVSVQYRF